MTRSYIGILQSVVHVSIGEQNNLEITVMEDYALWVLSWRRKLYMALLWSISSDANLTSSHSSSFHGWMSPFILKCFFIRSKNSRSKFCLQIPTLLPGAIPNKPVSEWSSMSISQSSRVLKLSSLCPFKCYGMIPQLLHYLGILFQPIF